MLKEVILDTIKIIPVLFIAFLLMEYIESKLSNDKLEIIIKKFGVLGASILALIPQCGFSVLAASLYIENRITLGTLIAVFIATSDETIPVLVSYPKMTNSIVLLLVIKLIIAISAGYLCDYIFNSNRFNIKVNRENGDESIFISSIKRTCKILVIIFITNLIISLIINVIGESNLNNILLSKSMFQPLIASLLGFIPNCAISVIFAELYINGSLSFASLVSGLIVNAGLGLIVLIEYRINYKVILKIMAILFVIALFSGFVIEFLTPFLL